MRMKTTTEKRKLKSSWRKNLKENYDIVDLQTDGTIILMWLWKKWERNSRMNLSGSKYAQIQGGSNMTGTE